MGPENCNPWTAPGLRAGALCPAVSLARARKIAHDNRSAIAQGRDPIAEKREAGLRRAPSIPTFAEAAARVIELRRPTWSNARYAARWENTLAAYAHPVIGNKTVDSITPADAMAVLTPIWTTKPETASRVRQRMEMVMDWAITHGYRLDNPAGRSLLKVLPLVKRLKEHRQASPMSKCRARWHWSGSAPPTSRPSWPLSFWY